MIRMYWQGTGDGIPFRITWDGDSGTYAPRWGSGVSKTKLDGNSVSAGIFGIVQFGIKSYMTFNNFEITNLSQTPGVPGAAIKGTTSGTSYITVSNCTIYSLGYYDHVASTSSVVMGTGPKTLTITGGTGKPYIAGMTVQTNYNSSTYMSATLASYNTETGVITVTMSACSHEGTVCAGQTYDVWTVGIGVPATGIQISGDYSKALNNTVYDTYGDGINVSNSNYGEIYNSTLYGRMKWPIVSATNTDSGITGMRIYNNTLYNVGKDFLWGPGTGRASGDQAYEDADQWY